MCKISPVLKQFLAIACCKLTKKWIFLQPTTKLKCLTETGNLLTFSFGISSGWTTINLLELQNEKSTFSTGPLNQRETSFVVSIVCVGAFFGNYIVLPTGRVIGIKRTIHLLSIPLIVRPFFSSRKLLISAKFVQFLFTYL